MSEYNNTIDTLGEEQAQDLFLSGEIEEIIDNTIVSVGEEVFNTCKKLITCRLPNLREMGMMLFNQCIELRTVELDFDNITSLETGIFAGCRYIESLDFPNVTYMSNTVFNGCTSLTIINAPKLNYTLKMTFTGSNIINANFPNLINPGEGCFYNLKKLKTLNIGNLEIMPRYFLMSSSIETINCGTTKELREAALMNCTNLTEISLDLISMGKCAMKGTSSHKPEGITFNSLETAEEGALMERSSETVIFKELMSISKFLLMDNSQLSSVTALKCIEINEGAFIKCIALSTINVPLVESIGLYAFLQCSSLEILDLDSCTLIKELAFAESGLRNLYLRSNTMCELKSPDAFQNTPIEKGEGCIYVKSALVDEYKQDLEWSKFADYIVAITD